MFRKTTLTIALLTSISVYADNLEYSDKDCDRIESVAEKVMFVRQNSDYSEDEFMDKIKGNINEENERDFVELTKKAFKEKKWHSPSFKKKAVLNFKKEIYYNCLS